MTQLDLVRAPAPPVPDRIDLRCCDVADVLASRDEPADLVVADPPWSYVQRIGETRAENHYACLTVPQIVAHVERAVGSRLALWITSPLLGEWPGELAGWGRPKTAGAWVKSDEGDTGHYGQGYHWAGCAELVLLYTCGGGTYTDRGAPLRSAWVEPPGEHSRKPARWQAQWIQRWVPPGGLVLDLYAGLGSVAEAVLLAGEGRRYVGAEIDPERHAAALGLLAQVRA